MKNKKRRTNKNKIRGNLVCFKDTELDEKAKRLLYAPLIEDELIEFRNIGKDAFGLRMQLAAKLSNVFKPISSDSLNIILEYLKTLDNHSNAEGFADCFFASYNGDNHMLINNPKCMTHVTSSALKHGLKDCIKAIDTYFRPIYLRMTKERTLELCENNIVGKYRDIKASLAFVVNFLYTLHCEKMPKKLSVEVFNHANRIDPKISKYYEYYDDIEKYILKENKNNRYSVLSQECATYIICYKHK